MAYYISIWSESFLKPRSLVK